MSTVTSLRTGVGPYLQLLRPANVVTAWADVLAGFAVTGVVVTFNEWAVPVDWGVLGGLLVATTGLYGGGVVFNDVFDAPLDAEERPERPIPSGRATRWGAALFGGILLAGGVGAAFWVKWISGLLALLIAGGALLYDAFSKHHFFFGPLNMGVCRGGNLLLGASAVPAVLGSIWYLLLLPVAYIAAITAISQGEVHGGRRVTGVLAVALVAGVIGGVLLLSIRGDYRLLHASPFLLVFAGQVLPPFVRAAHTPSPERIRDAVEAGVKGLIPLNAALAAGFAGWGYGLGVFLLLPLSVGLGRLFAIT